MEQKKHSKKQMDFEGGPRFSLIIPFSPLMNSAKNLFEILKNAGDEAEEEINIKYSREQALPLIKMLRGAISDVKCNANEKTLAIFVTGVAKDIYYFTPTETLAMPSHLVYKPD